MGAGQSSERGGGSTVEVVKTSYYELLGVTRQATEDEIKKAYRRKALELHPDRNYGNEEAATRTFAEVQAAYEVLSDVQERAWYDSHESAILRGDDGTQDGGDGAPVYQNVRLTTADDLARMLRKFNSAVEFSDAPSGFYGFLREVFAQLAKEEEAAAMWEDVEVPDYPTFGHKADAYDDVVRRFYTAWMSFSTVKSFAWRDKYKLSEAPDRWYRRRMEQENKAFRKEGIREFNDGVRAFVAFVRKRDPRYIPSTQSEAERAKILRDAANSQATKARAANQAKLAQEIPAWATERNPEDEEELFSEEEEIVEEILECVVCDKTFKSEKQYEAHERSKKHQKALHALKKRMRKENAHLDLDGQTSSGVATPDVGEEEEEVLDDLAVETENHHQGTNGHAVVTEEDDVDEEQVVSGNASEDEAGEEPVSKDTSPKDEDTDSEDDEDDDYATAEAVRARLQSSTLSDNDTPLKSQPEETEPESASQPQPKMGKAAQKRAKKAAAAAAANDDSSANSQTCTTCGAAFPSRTRLFQHIKDHGHGALKTVASGGGGGKGKKKGKR